MRTFVIGDVHGDHIALRALLARAGITTSGTDVGAVQVVQLGDLGDYRFPSLVGDESAWRVATDFRFRVLLGNHEMGIIDPERHSFKDQFQPNDVTMDMMLSSRPVFAMAAEGVLLTHAGLALGHFHPNEYASGVEMLARQINNMGRHRPDPIIDAIAEPRGGSDPVGGVLWKAEAEQCAPVRQVFGHNRGGMIRTYDGGRSMCIDIANRQQGTLAGIWLDTMQVIAVGPDAIQHESYPPMELS